MVRSTTVLGGRIGLRTVISLVVRCHHAQGSLCSAYVFLYPDATERAFILLALQKCDILQEYLKHYCVPTMIHGSPREKSSWYLNSVRECPFSSAVSVKEKLCSAHCTGPGTHCPPFHMNYSVWACEGFCRAWPDRPTAKSQFLLCQCRVLEGQKELFPEVGCLVFNFAGPWLQPCSLILCLYMELG